MEINAKYAVIGYNPNLTDPGARSVPLAILGVCPVNDTEGLVLTITPAVFRMNIPQLQRDPISKKLLGDFQEFIYSQIKAALPQARATTLLTALSKQLRNTINIDSVGDVTFKYKNNKELVQNATHTFIKLFEEKVAHSAAMGRNPGEERNASPYGDFVPDIGFRTLSSLEHSVSA